MRFRNYLCEAAWVRRAGSDPSCLGGDRRANRFLLRRNVATMKGGTDVIPGIFGPLLGPLQEIGPDWVGG